MTEETPSHVTGHFSSPESARAAMIRLEGAGFDADAVDLIGLPATTATPEAAHDADTEAVGDVAKQATVGASLGAAAGAAAGVVAGVVSGDPGAALTVGAAAAVGGSVVGGLAGTYTGLPVNEAAWTTYELDPTDPHPVTVRVRVTGAESAESARTALRS